MKALNIIVLLSNGIYSRKKKLPFVLLLEELELLFQEYLIPYE